MFTIFKKAPTKEQQFDTENLPFIYQSEFYSLAWGKVHHGFYILPDGRKYNYREPEQWNFYNSAQNPTTTTPFKTVWGYETDGTFEVELLFENLRNSFLLTGLLGGAIVKPNPINLEKINDLKQAKIIDYGMLVTDQGTLSNSILAYDETIKLYRRILLTSSGQRDKVNQSDYTKTIIDALGIINTKTY